MTTSPKSRRSLTELEACVLGVVAREGPCTAYTVRSIFAASPTQRWSGSAGAIYPLMRRLHKKGLLAAEKKAQGARPATAYTATGEGRARLRAWLVQGDAEEAVSLPVDPVRTQLHFLQALQPSERRQWADETLRRLKAQIAPLREEWDSGKYPTQLERLAACGALNLAEARLAWFEAVHKALSTASPPA